MLHSVMSNHTRTVIKQYLLAGVVAAVYFVVAQLAFGTVCPLLYTVGLPCPGCGLTRAGLLLGSGRFIESLRMHPLLLPTVVYVAVAAYVKLRRPDKFSRLNLPGILLLVAIVGLYVFRMIRLFPHTPPMEPNEDAILRTLFNLIWRN